MNDFAVYTISVEENNSIGKNKILKKHKAEGKEKYIFIQQDDLKISNNDVYYLYISMMKKYDIPTAFYSFYKTANRIFNKMINPIGRITVTDDAKIFIVRKPIDAFICLDMEKIPDDLIFDENLKAVEYEYFLFSLYQKELLPIFGFYLEALNSNNFVNEDEKYEYKNVKTLEDVKADKKYFQDNKIDMKQEINMDSILNYIKDKHTL